jgi:hypothetical protein
MCIRIKQIFCILENTIEVKDSLVDRLKKTVAEKYAVEQEPKKKRTKNQPQESAEKVSGVIIQAPDGELVNAGLSYESHDQELNNLFDKYSNCNCHEEVVYRLIESILPFLFFTNKFSKDVSLDFPKNDKMSNFPSKKKFQFS